MGSAAGGIVGPGIIVPVLLQLPSPQPQPVGSQANRLRIRRCNRPSRQKPWPSLQFVVQVSSQQPVLHVEANQR